MKILHVVPGLDDRGNGIAVAARLIAKGQREAGHEVDMVETREFVKRGFAAYAHTHGLRLPDEIWVHSNWWLWTLWACRKVIRSGVPLVRMTHANLDPLRLRYHWWKKLPMSMIERYLYRHTARVVVTCEAERRWCEEWGVRGAFEVIDLKRFFDLRHPFARTSQAHGSLHVLYLGRNHPLKGVRYLRQAVEGVKGVELREVSDHFDAELEADWKWCDVLCLPTLSENFGLVVAEALSRGKPVVTTDGAPVWESQNGVTYLRGYRDGTDDERVEMLKNALIWYNTRHVQNF